MNSSTNEVSSDVTQKDLYSVPAVGPLYEPIKRAIDLAITVPVLVVLSPVLAACIGVIRVESPGPAIFRQTRVGKHGKTFTCLKLRTMESTHDTGRHREYLQHLIENGDSAVAEHMPAREITRSGAVLRKLSLDELPQLINVVRGEMSLVGPRPPIDYEVDNYADWHKKRLAVTPGITGYWQITGRGKVTFDEMCRLDIDYIKKRSILLDLKIIASTPLAMLRGSG